MRVVLLGIFLEVQHWRVVVGGPGALEKQRSLQHWLKDVVAANAKA